MKRTEYIQFDATTHGCSLVQCVNEVGVVIGV